MTIVSTLSICLAALFAFLLGRSVVINIQRDDHNRQLKGEVARLNNRLNRIANHKWHCREFEIEEDESRGSYNVTMNVCVRNAADYIDEICPCHIKSFPFDDDKEFAKNEAEELLDKLNEKS